MDWFMKVSKKLTGLLFFIFLSTLVLSSSTSRYHEFLNFIDTFAQKPFLLSNLPEEKEYFFYSFNRREINILKNTLFARHGYILGSPKLKAFFQGRSWYKPVSKKVTLSAADEKNLEYIKKHEKKTEFSKFLAHFKMKKLPVAITSDKYGEEYKTFIPHYFYGIYFNICCPNIYGLDKININKDYFLLLYEIRREGSSFCIKTFNHNGQPIATQFIAG